jgi:RND family efflux transporter MFP subunit
MKFIISLIAIVLSIVISIGLYTFRPVTKKTRPTRPVPLVKTMDLVQSNERVFIEAFGTVIPAKQINIQAEVAGRIVELNSELVPGGIIKQNSLVVKIDPRDYKLRTKQRQADLSGAQYKLETEEGRQIVARQEWQLLEKDVDTSLATKSLALRQPHIKHAKAELEAAKSMLAEAALAEERTTILAPFNGLVLQEWAEKGQIVNRQSTIANMVGTDSFWVQASVPLSQLSRMVFPENNQEKGSPVKVILDSDRGKQIIRKGAIYKLLGDLDPKGRMARILITVDDPLNLTASSKADRQKRKLLLGSYVKVEIDAGVIDKIYVIPSHAIRDGESIWLVDQNGLLDIRQASIVWKRKNQLLISAPVEPYEKLITSRLQSPLQGMAVRIDNGNFPN